MRAGEETRGSEHWRGEASSCWDLERVARSWGPKTQSRESWGPPSLLGDPDQVSPVWIPAGTLQSRVTPMWACEGCGVVLALRCPFWMKRVP